MEAFARSLVAEYRFRKLTDAAISISWQIVEQRSVLNRRVAVARLLRLETWEIGIMLDVPRKGFLLLYSHMNIDQRHHVYIMTNKRNTVLYTGKSSDLVKRVWEHKNKVIDGFTKRYNINKLVYYEEFATADEALLRERQIKAGSRKKKIELIESMNPEWKDLSDDFEF